MTGKVETDNSPMPLAKALYILAEAYTKYDSQVGIVVDTALPDRLRIMFSYTEFIEAWKSVRYNIGKEMEPAK